MIKTSATVKCDGCQAEVNLEPDPRYGIAVAWKVPVDWRAVHRPDGTHHYCPACKAPEQVQEVKS